MEQTSTGAQERWTTVISKQRASGLKVRNYCEQNSINTKTFYSWSKRLALGNTKPNNFIKLIPPVIIKPVELHIETPNGYHIDIKQANDLKSVLEMLRAL